MRDGRVNSYLVMREIVSYKMHAAVCFLLGSALNGLIEGAITRFELSLFFKSCINYDAFVDDLSSRPAWIYYFLTKPETSLQIIMFVFF